MAKKLVFGVGINDADYKATTYGYKNGVYSRIWACPFHLRWRSMLERGFCEKLKTKRPTYKDVTVCEEWLTFSNFKAWMEQQDWEGNELDKDILVRGNKVYCQEACCFIPSQVNNFVCESGKIRGEFPIGVSLYRGKKYQSRCSNPFTKKDEYLGYYLTPEEAHAAWLKRKQELALQLAAEQKDERVAKAIIDRYFNYSEQEV